MKKNLLFTTALVATTFTASGVLAADPVSITTQEALNQYIDSGKGASWTDIVRFQVFKTGRLKTIMLKTVSLKLMICRLKTLP